MVELVIRGLCTTSIAETMNVLLQHLRSSPVEEQALVAVLLLYFDHTLVCCFSKCMLLWTRIFIVSFMDNLGDNIAQETLVCAQLPDRKYMY